MHIGETPAEGESLFLQDSETESVPTAVIATEGESMGGWLTISTLLSFGILSGIAFLISRKQKQGVTVFTPYEDWERL